MKRIVIATLLLVGAAGCTRNHPSAAHAVTPAATSVPPTLDPTSTVATIDGQVVTAKDVDEEIAPQLGRLSQAFQSDEFELRKQALDELVIRRLVAAEARKEGTTEAAWLEKHIGPTPEVSEADARAFYDQNSARMDGRSFDQEKPHIIAFLNNRKRQEAAAKVFDGLKGKAKIDVLLESPAVDVAAVGPSLGPETAPVTIVEFSDFQCPFCSKVEPTIKRVMAEYAGKVRFVFRDYPLPFHPNAEKAAEASHCAEAQGAYWPMHDALFANQDKLDVDGLKKLAGGLAAIDQAKFDRCLDSSETKDQVDGNEKAGEAVGVSGTPHFFVNGHSIDGSQPYEEFKKAIDRELTRTVSAR